MTLLENPNFENIFKKHLEENIMKFKNSDYTTVLNLINGIGKENGHLADKNCPEDVKNHSTVDEILETPCDWRSSPDPNLKKLMLMVVEMLLEKAVFEGTSRDTKVIQWKSPTDLKSSIDLEIVEKGVPQGKILELMTDVVKYSVKTGHPFFINQLFSSLDPFGLIGQWVTDALNPSVYTYEVAPVFTLMEIEVLSAMSKFVGYSTFDGVFAPGGSISNMYGMIIARHHFFPESKDKGLVSVGRLAAFTSIDAHYSIKKGCMTLGIGSENLYLVDVDIKGRMCVESLKKQIGRAKKEGAKPFFVCATAGTTVLGSFDPISEIADVCNQEGLWLHVDAAWGGGALLSPELKYKLEGVERSDSITWNPHKLMAAPQQCSVLITKHEGLLESANSAKATYLFQKDKFYDTSYDTGDKYIQCGRRADVMKIWTMWKAKGTEGMRKHIESIFSSANSFVDIIKSRPGFQLLMEPECTNVCFWYEPPSLRSRRNDPNYKKLLHAVAPKIKEKMVKDGSMMITYQPLRIYPNFFRLVLQNSSVTLSDVKYFADTIEDIGKRM